MTIDGYNSANQRIKVILVYAGTVLSFVSAALFLMSAIVDEQIHNSDILYAPSFFDDLWRGIDVTGWALTPAPYFFPDFLVYGFFDSIFHLANVGVATRVDLSLRFSSAAFYTMNGFLFAFLLRQLFASKPSIVGGLWVWLGFTAIVFFTPFKYDFIAAHIVTNHSGAITATLLFWILWFIEVPLLSKTRTICRYFGLFALVVLTLVSDLQFLTLAVIPAILVHLVLLINAADRKNLIFDLLWVGVAAISAFRLRPRIRYQLIYFPNVDGLDLIKRTIRHLPDLKFESLLNVGLFWPVIILIIVFVTFMFIRQKISHQFYSVYLGSLFTTVAAIAIQLGLTVDYNEIEAIPNRYFLYLYGILLPVWLASILFQFNLHWFKDLIWNHTLVSSCILLLSILLLMVSVRFVSILNRGKQSLAANQAQCLIDFIDSKKINDQIVYGVSDYWLAKRLSLFGRSKIRLMPVKADAVNEVYFWITNLNWFHDDQIVYQFAITQGLDQESLLAHYGKPVTVSKCDRFEIWWYGSQSPIQQKATDLRKFGSAIGIPWSQIEP